MAGHQTLTLAIKVRILVPQPRNPTPTLPKELFTHSSIDHAIVIAGPIV